MNTSAKGKLGEERAADFFEKQGYRIIERNYRGAGGEVDLIARKDDELVFIEVKHWSTYSEENIEYGINPGKIRRILRASRVFLAERPGYETHHVRYDVVFVPTTEEKMIHYKDAFREEA